MARYRDPVVAEVKKVRRELSRRLMKAHRHGRLHEELMAMDREGAKAYREVMNGSANGHGSRKKK